MIEENLDDGYWIETFQLDDQTPVGFVAFGLGRGELKVYPNPYTNTEKTKPFQIQKLITPNGMTQADISGDGFQDIVACFDYGNTIIDFNPNGGYIVWLENPGKKNSTEPWKRHYVGRSATMHRLKIGHFTQTKRWEIIGLPIVNGPFDVPVPVLLCGQPDNLLNATAWDCETIDEEFFHLIHDATMFKVDSLDQLLIASREGLSWLYYNENSREWIIEKIADGEQEEKQQTNYYGSGGVAIGKVGSDTFAYIAAIEPFHGNVISVYTKTANNSLTQVQWQRHVLDVYGHPNENGEGTAHYVVCADFDKDGDDEFLVALRGPTPYEGVFYYKPIDLSRGLFAKWQISDVSAARIALADFDNDSFIDFATVGYYVLGYYLANNPSINVFYNRLGSKTLEVKNKLQVTKQNDELLFSVPRPNQILQYHVLPFLTIGNITLSLEVLPPYSSRQVGKNTYIKVLWGIITWKDSSNKSQQPMNHSRTFLCKPKNVCSLEIHSDDNRIKTGSEGAIFIVLQLPKDTYDIPRFNDIKKVMIENSLPESYPEEARKVGFKFIKVDELEWGKEKFKGLEFYNMRGFDIKFADNNEHLCYIQLWAAGKGTNAGVHNHNTDRFCEVHACIVNGNGNSGMHYLKSSADPYDPLTTSDDEFVKLVVPSFHEHGPLWDINARKEPVLREDGTVVYPWHKWQSGGNNSSESLCSEIPSARSLAIDGSKAQATNKSMLKTKPQRRRCASASQQSYDVWIAFEFNPNLSTLPE
ncbi:unnamed protein product [Rotaria sp. Silwood1]|nr:unnamed protein product [Rotaria sp. Silwood1]CAF1363923.1 unnamed protein product [Rotaria sp. Silwood1]CAF1364858.1 unnamed protein product [Rotaria sp. Silwood1]CAF3524961.1 unnamed protein product [Rotaria sp. Silwood1]CAF3544123.1 unnamed protein product [Rotaria sp. Silwood1]